MRSRFLASVIVFVVALSTFGALPAQASQAELLEEVLENNTLQSNSVGTERDVLADIVDHDLLTADNDKTVISDTQGKILLHRAPEVPMLVTSDEGTVGIGVPFQQTASEPFEISDGLIGYRNGNESTTVRAIKEDGSAQTATVLDSSSAPERFDYPLTVPDGAVLEVSGEVVLVISSTGDFIGGFAPAWATDANGTEVPTEYVVNGTTITQLVTHQAGDFEYPIVADPLYSRGMIASVNREQFVRGGYEMDIKVTALARGAWLNSPLLVAQRGREDLQEHHGRSMNASNIQQWNCHVAGLPGTFTINLEGWRRSYPDWRARIAPSVIKANPAAACNW